MDVLDEGPLGRDVYHVYSLCYARLPERRIHENFMMPPDLHDGPMPLNYNLWIIRNADRTVLVDTGFGPRAATERRRPLDIDPMEALERIGIQPDSITDVILTHMHYDHAGNLERLPRARLHVQDKEVAFATGRRMCHAALRFPYDIEDVVNLVRCTHAERVRHHDGPAYPFPGISLHPLTGHSRGLQGVRVTTPHGAVLLASDAGHFYANLARRSPFALTVDAADTLQSYEAMLELVKGVHHSWP